MNRANNSLTAVVEIGAMATANNLSDVASASTSRANLGVAIGSDVQAYSAILDATTASFTTAAETKLDGIEALADVTDATNVVSSLNGASITAVTVATVDKVLAQDVSDSDNLKTITAQSIADLRPRVGVYRVLPVPAGAMVSRTTNGALSGTKEYTTNKINVDYFDFDASTNEYVQFSMFMPDEWDLSTIKAKVYWTTSDTAGTGNVIWGVQAVAISNDDTLDVAMGTAQTVTDGFLLDSDLHVTSATSAITVGGTPILGDLVVFQVYRDASNGSDTYTQDARLLGVAIQYKELTTEPVIW